MEFTTILYSSIIWFHSRLLRPNRRVYTNMIGNLYVKTFETAKRIFLRELDFLYKLKYYLSRRIVDVSKLERGTPIDLGHLTGASPDPQGFEQLFQWRTSMPKNLIPDTEFHTKCLCESRLEYGITISNSICTRVIVGISPRWNGFSVG